MHARPDNAVSNLTMEAENGMSCDLPRSGGIRIGRHRRGPVAVTHLRRHVSVAAEFVCAKDRRLLDGESHARLQTPSGTRISSRRAPIRAERARSGTTERPRTFGSQYRRTGTGAQACWHAPGPTPVCTVPWRARRRGALTPGWGDARSAFPFFRCSFVSRGRYRSEPAPPFREDPRVEADVSTQSQESQADPWFPQADEHQGGT